MFTVQLQGPTRTLLEDLMSRLNHPAEYILEYGLRLLDAGTRKEAQSIPEAPKNPRSETEIARRQAFRNAAERQVNEPSTGANTLSKPNKDKTS
jgi:hypothetical protein